MKHKHLFTVVLVVLFVLAISIGLYFLSKKDANAPEGYKKVEDYNHVEPGQVRCLAVDPSCGYCPGDVIDKECYVKE